VAARRICSFCRFPRLFGRFGQIALARQGGALAQAVEALHHPFDRARRGGAPSNECHQRVTPRNHDGDNAGNDTTGHRAAGRAGEADVPAPRRLEPSPPAPKKIFRGAIFFWGKHRTIARFERRVADRPRGAAPVDGNEPAPTAAE